MRKLSMLKKGFTLLEVMAALVLGSLVVISLVSLLQRFQDDQIAVAVGKDFISIASAFDQRFAVDGFSANNFPKKTWNSNAEVNNLLNSLNGIDSKCQGAAWIPNVDDTAIVAKYRKEKLIFCDLWKNKAPYDTNLKSELRIEPNNNQVIALEITMEFKNKAEFDKNFKNIQRAINSAKRTDSKNNSGKHTYSLINLKNDEDVTARQCAALNKDCAVKIGILTNEADTNIHLSTIGENKQIGKLSFSKGVLNPQVCQKWSKLAGGPWTSENVVCGIESVDNKISFHINETANNFVLTTKLCNVITAGGGDKPKDTDYLDANTTDYTSVYSGTIPCGISSKSEAGDIIVTNISEDTSADKIFSKNTFNNKTNANSFKTAFITVINNSTVKETSTVKNKTTAESGYNGSILTVTNAAPINTNNFKTESNLQINNNLTGRYVGTENNLNVINKIDVDNRLNTFKTNIGSLTTNSFIGLGDYSIAGNINAKSIVETGVLYPQDIALSSDTKVESSAVFGGVGASGGQSLPSATTGGLNTTSALIDQSVFLNGGGIGVNDYQFQIKNGGNMVFGATYAGGVYIKGGLNVYDGYGAIKYQINQAGDITVNNNHAIFYGSGVGMPAQFHGDIYVSGTYNVTAIDRYVDVVDTNTNLNAFVPDPKFITYYNTMTIPQIQQNSIISDNRRLGSYAGYINNYEANYNNMINAINTPGLKGDTGDTGPVGDKGQQGDKGAQGNQGPIGPTGPLYNPDTNIWLPKEVTCASGESELKSKYNVSTISSWTYPDVIEGVCQGYATNAIKYFERTTPLTNTCSSNQKEYDVYECKPAKFRKEPYAFNFTTQGSFCLGDSNTNVENPAEGITDEDKKTICFTDLNKNHLKDKRATSFLGLYTSVGGGSFLGTANNETSLISTIGKNVWTVTDSCGGNVRDSEDLKGVEQADFIESNYKTISASDNNMACSTKNEVRYRKVASSYTTKYGEPTDFINYKNAGFKNVSKYVSNQGSQCDREQLYELSLCTSAYDNLSQVDYTTHPKGFPMPKPEVDTGNGNGGMTGKFIWLKDSTVCVAGDIKDTYKDVSLWYSSDRIYSQCSVENSYRYESVGACGSNSENTSYQLYRCRDEFYKPQGTSLSWSIADIKCINEDSTVGAVGDINDSYPNIEFFDTEPFSGQSCSTERGYKAFKGTFNSCSPSGTRYTVYQCK